MAFRAGVRSSRRTWPPGDLCSGGAPLPVTTQIATARLPAQVAVGRSRARWRPALGLDDGPVDRSKSHLELRYGSADDSGWDKWLPVARVGPPRDRTFPVEWIVDRADPAHREAADAVAKELDFYLVEKGEVDPWVTRRTTAALRPMSTPMCTGRCKKERANRRGAEGARGD